MSFSPEHIPNSGINLVASLSPKVSKEVENVRGALNDLGIPEGKSIVDMITAEDASQILADMIGVS